MDKPRAASNNFFNYLPYGLIHKKWFYIFISEK